MVPSVSTAEQALQALRGAVESRGYRAWLVGGTVRDLALGRASSDIDVVVATDNEGVHRLAVDLARSHGLSRFTLSSRFGAERIVFASGHLDLSPLRGTCIEHDLALRDFTVNAMALPLCGGPPCDPFLGRVDLEERRLAVVGDRSFRDDPVRLLRAVRFAHQLGFTISSATIELARRDAHLLSVAAAERVLTEVVAALDVGHAAQAVRLWDQLGLLAVVFPEVAALKGVEQSTNHHRDVYGHTLEALEHLDALLEDPSPVFPETAALIRKRFATNVDGSVSRRTALRLAVLLHDIAKPQTKRIDELGRLSFQGHESRGVPAARAVCVRLKTSRPVADLVSRVVLGHLWLGFLQNRRPLWHHDEVEYLWQARPFEPELIMASVADRLATRGPMTAPRFLFRHLTLARHLMWLWSERELHGVPRLPLRGDEVAEVLGIQAGPLLGRLLARLRLEWEAGELADDAAVVARARELVATGVVS